MLHYDTRQFVDADRGSLQLAVIIPTYNEHDNVEELIARLDIVLVDLRHELVFVDDGSTDGTPELIERLAAERRDIRLIRRIGRRGLASAVVEGMLASAAAVLAVIDADLQHDEMLIPSLHGAIAAGADVAIGSRYADGGSVRDWSRARTRISRFATALTGRVLRSPLSDPMSGFFAVRREVMLAAAPRMSLIGYKVLIDLLASAPHELVVREVPYGFRCRQAGESKLSAVVVGQFIMLLYDKLFGRYVPLRFAMFIGVGFAGVGVHLLTLELVLGMTGIVFVEAQVIASLTAMTGNFFLNNCFTYRDRRLVGWDLLRGLVSFNLVCGISLLANVGVAKLIYESDHRWWVAGLAGAAIGSVWNYALSSTLTWRRA